MKADLRRFTAVTTLGLLFLSGTVHAAETSFRDPVSTASWGQRGADNFAVLSRGGDAGPYAAFPDATRQKDGSIKAVFYSGYSHVSLPKEGWEKGGFICSVTSTDEGKTWSAPSRLFDDERDNRDPHIAQLADGTQMVTFFSLMPKPDKARGYVTSGTELLSSSDGGKTWHGPRVIAPGWYVSAPVRELKDGTLALGVYGSKDGEKLGGVLLSSDKGKTWSEPKLIGVGQDLPLDAETDIIELKDGRLFAALRTSQKNLYYSYSSDMGKTWGPAVDAGFRGHAPHLYRTSKDAIIMMHRLPDTSFHVSRDETATWQGPYLVDRVFGAYPATVELKDGSLLVVYYTEGKASEVRSRRFKLKDDGPEYY